MLSAENKVVIDELKAKLRHAEELLQIANKRMNECLHSTIIVNILICNVKYFCCTELEENRKRVEELETSLTTMLYCSMLQVTGNGKEWSIVNEETSIKVSFPSQSAKPLPFPLEQISCQLTDPWNKQVPCSITPTQPGVCTVMYTPTIRGPHQLSIKIKDTDIQGSPYRVNVLPEADSGVMQHTISKVKDPRSVAVSKSGDVAVTHTCRQDFNFWSNHISVFNKKREKKLSFITDVLYSHVAFTADNDNISYILAVGGSNPANIVRYTMEGSPSISAKCLQSSFISSIAVHPTGKVILTGSIGSTCIQVLNSDLSHSHVFSICFPGPIEYPHVACDSDGVVYVAGETCIRSSNIDGQQCIGKFSYDFIPVKSSIHGVCIDSTNTLYVLDKYKKCVSVLSSSGKFIKCLKLCDEDEHKLLAGIAVDNTTGALYVCDYRNDCVIVRHVN